MSHHSATNNRNDLPVCFPGLLAILDATQFTSYRTRSRTVKTDERVVWRGLCAPSRVTSQTNCATYFETSCRCPTANQRFCKLLSSLHSSSARISDEDPLRAAVDKHVVFHGNESALHQRTSLFNAFTPFHRVGSHLMCKYPLEHWRHLRLSCRHLLQHKSSEIFVLQLSKARFISRRTKLYSHDVRFHMSPLVCRVLDSDLFEQSVQIYDVSMSKKNLSVHLSLEQQVARYHLDENDYDHSLRQ